MEQFLGFVESEILWDQEKTKANDVRVKHQAPHDISPQGSKKSNTFSFSVGYL
jgi:hypothetical protein